MEQEKYKRYAPVVLRVSISLVFFWFGLNQIFDSASWVGWLPQWLLNLPIDSNRIIQTNGLFEVIFAGLMLMGKYLKIVPLLLSIHLFIIALSLGYNEISIRDIGLALSTFVIFLNGPDKYCLDFKKKR